jgi:TetR/AcrR family fatty acid metabolism transcriptional regulator
MDDIAREAKVAKGTLYLYFKSKQELFTVFIDSIFQEIFSTLNLIKDSKLNCLEKIKLFIKNNLVFFSKHKQFFSILLRETRVVDKALDTKYKQKIYIRYNKISSALSKIIQQGIKENLLRPVDVRLATEILNSIITSVIFTNIKSKHKQNLSRQTKNVLNIFLYGLGK